MKRGGGFTGDCLRPLGCKCPGGTICDYYHSDKPVNGADVLRNARRYPPPPSEPKGQSPWSYPDAKPRDPFGGQDDILTVLQDINQERASQYGTPEDNFARIARHWKVYLLNAKGLDVDITPTDVALLMDLMKTARLENMPGHRDSWVDKAGYARCGAAIEANLARFGRKEKP